MTVWRTLLVAVFFWYFVGEFSLTPYPHGHRVQRTYRGYLAERECLAHMHEWESNPKEVEFRRVIVQTCRDDGRRPPRAPFWGPWMSNRDLWRLQEVG